MNLLQDAGMTACFTEHSCTPKYWGEAEMAIAQRANLPRSIEVMNIQNQTGKTGIARIVFPDGVGYISGFHGGTHVKEVSEVLQELEAELQAPC